MPKAKTKRRRALLLGGVCSHRGCRIASIFARKITRDMWVEYCAEHQKAASILLDVEKIGTYIDADRVRPKA